MELSSTQRERIEANCLRTSWQLLTPWLLRHTGSASNEPTVLIDWLSQAADAAQNPVLELLRHMEHRFWQVEAPLASERSSDGLLALTVVCGGLRWTLLLQRPPGLRVMQARR